MTSLRSVPNARALRLALLAWALGACGNTQRNEPSSGGVDGSSTSVTGGTAGGLGGSSASLTGDTAGGLGGSSASLTGGTTGGLGGSSASVTGGVSGGMGGSSASLTGDTAGGLGGSSSASITGGASGGMGGSGEDESLASALLGRGFVLESAQGFAPVEGTTLTLAFAGKFYFGAGCNAVSNTYSICGDSLCAGGTWSGPRFQCSVERQAQDEVLTQFFSAEPALALDGDTLTVTGSDAVLVFGPAPTAETLSSELLGMAFELLSAQGFAPVEGTTVSISFEKPPVDIGTDTPLEKPVFIFRPADADNAHAQVYSLCGDRLCLFGELAGDGRIYDPNVETQAEWLARFFTAQPALALAVDRLTVTGPDAELVFGCVDNDDSKLASCP